MAKTRRTPRPQKSPAKDKAAVNKMKGSATTVPRSPNEPDVPDEAEVKVGIESVVWDHPESEQKIKADEISVDDGTTGIQSVLEAAAAVVALSGAMSKKSAPAVGAKKPNAKKPSPSKRKMLAKNPPPRDDQVFWLRFSELFRYKAEHGTTTVPRSKHGTNNALANWVHYIRKRYASDLLADKHKNSLNGINFEWTVGQIAKKGFEGWFAELVEYQKQTGTVEVLGDNNKNNTQLANWGNYARRTAIAVLTKKNNNAEFTLQLCKMLLDTGLVPLHFYQYGSYDNDEVGAQQDSTRRNETKTITEITKSVNQSLAATTMNMTQFVASTPSKMAKDNTTGNKTHSPAATASNAAQSLAATNSNVTVDNDHRKPAAV
jgi:hypothetical protein